ncbi:hypothetical protein STCU_10296 [Strigomonas culicis]|uniref:Uncharacterized protein n=1 Tax=Strigomonas culicis TaxID=28005 RepID=S9TNI2_9TRYP|nr:hypothetical protein STCU_10296 [Strigomonas culicis]|eukprot:EPY17948.1 hypothetical protein STCU_10296 [Strigomonas culicis]
MPWWRFIAAPAKDGGGPRRQMRAAALQRREEERWAVKRRERVRHSKLHEKIQIAFEKVLLRILAQSFLIHGREAAGGGAGSASPPPPQQQQPRQANHTVVQDVLEVLLYNVWTAQAPVRARTDRAVPTDSMMRLLNYITAFAGPSGSQPGFGRPSPPVPFDFVALLKMVVEHYFPKPRWPNRHHHLSAVLLLLALMTAPTTPAVTLGDEGEAAAAEADGAAAPDPCPQNSRILARGLQMLAANEACMAAGATATPARDGCGSAKRPREAPAGASPNPRVARPARVETPPPQPTPAAVTNNGADPLFEWIYQPQRNRMLVHQPAIFQILLEHLLKAETALEPSELYMSALYYAYPCQRALFFLAPPAAGAGRHGHSRYTTRTNTASHSFTSSLSGSGLATPLWGAPPCAAPSPLCLPGRGGDASGEASAWRRPEPAETIFPLALGPPAAATGGCGRRIHEAIVAAPALHFTPMCRPFYAILRDQVIVLYSSLREELLQAPATPSGAIGASWWPQLSNFFFWQILLCGSTAQHSYVVNAAHYYYFRQSCEQHDAGHTVSPAVPPLPLPPTAAPCEAAAGGPTTAAPAPEKFLFRLPSPLLVYVAPSLARAPGANAEATQLLHSLITVVTKSVFLMRPTGAPGSGSGATPAGAAPASAVGGGGSHGAPRAPGGAGVNHQAYVPGNPGLVLNRNYQYQSNHTVRLTSQQAQHVAFYLFPLYRFLLDCLTEDGPARGAGGGGDEGHRRATSAIRHRILMWVVRQKENRNNSANTNTPGTTEEKAPAESLPVKVVGTSLKLKLMQRQQQGGGSAPHAGGTDRFTNYRKPFTRLEEILFAQCAAMAALSGVELFEGYYSGDGGGGVAPGDGEGADTPTVRAEANGADGHERSRRHMIEVLQPLIEKYEVPPPEEPRAASHGGPLNGASPPDSQLPTHTLTFNLAALEMDGLLRLDLLADCPWPLWR